MAAGCAPEVAKLSELVMHTVLIDVGVPMRVLEEKHSDPRLAMPPSLAKLSEVPPVVFKVPPDSPDICILDIPLQTKEGTIEQIVAYLPANANEGDTLNLRKRDDGTWRLAKVTTELSVLMHKGYAPGHEVQTQTGDGNMLSFVIPDNVDPGDIVDLKRGEDGAWMLAKIRKIPPLNEMSMPAFTLEGPYRALLQMLLDKGLLHRLPLDQNGILHVSIPFCAGLLEFPMLADFLSKHFLTLPGVNGIHVLGTELFDNYASSWAINERWCDNNHPKIQLRIRVQDLSADPLPPAGLTLALHPEATKGGPWFGIIGSLVRSSIGVCVFTNFFGHEKQTTVNMSQMYRRQAGATESEASAGIEAMDNPFYAVDKPEFPPMAYFVVVEGPSLRPL